MISCIDKVQFYNISCPVTSCSHNFFYEKIPMKKPKETGVTKKYHSCMCLLREDLTLDQIGDIWGLTRERVRQLEEGALQHLARVVSNKRADLESRDVEWKLERLIKVLVESQKMRKERKRIWEV